MKQQCFVLGPSAAELIALFLYQADVASSIAREIVGKENVSVNGTPVDSSAQYDGSLWLIFECTLKQIMDISNLISWQ